MYDRRILIIVSERYAKNASAVFSLKMRHASGSTPDWNAIEADVIRKLRLLRIAWEHTESRSTTEIDIHSAIKRDIYLPALNCLAQFCGCVREEEEKRPKCACRRSDARECYQSRHPVLDDGDQIDDDEECECGCHQGDQDGLTEWDHLAGLHPDDKEFL